MTFAKYDKVLYIGNQIPTKVYTVLQELTVAGKSVVEIVFGEKEKHLVVPEMLQFIRHGAPLYAEGKTIYYLSGPSLIKCTVRSVEISYTTEPNEYRIVPDEGQRIIRSLTVVEGDLYDVDPTKTKDSSVTTLKHISRVRELCGKIAILMIERGDRHDASKMYGVEKLFLDMMEYTNEVEGKAPFGSPEYIRRARMLKPMLKSHFQNNSHHPEHYENGINGMDLLDVVEMACDWVAASERNEDLKVGLTHAAKRFEMSDQLKRIFANTYERMGIVYE